MPIRKAVFDPILAEISGRKFVEEFDDYPESKTKLNHSSVFVKEPCYDAEVAVLLCYLVTKMHRQDCSVEHTRERQIDEHPPKGRTDASFSTEINHF